MPETFSEAIAKAENRTTKMAAKAFMIMYLRQGVLLCTLSYLCVFLCEDNFLQRCLQTSILLRDSTLMVTGGDHPTEKDNTSIASENRGKKTHEN